MAKQILGKVLPIPRGDYNSSTQYAMLDIVGYNGNSYIAKQNVQGQAPTNTTYWQLLARQGDKPVYKVDYLTDAEMDEIVADIISDSTNTFNQNVTAKTTEFNNNASDKTTDFNSNATSKTSDFNTNASSKTTVFNTNASDKQSDFNSNASSTKDDFDRNATSKTEAYDDNASSKLSAYNSNHTDKLSAYNSNASDKTTAYNNNATAKTEAFNDNYDSKIELFDEHSEELQEQLDRYKTLENALPHVNGEGESITLNDTAKSPLTMDLEPTELSQDSEPSPSSPQNIHVVSGDNEIKIGNKNLLNKNNWVKGYINSSGEITNQNVQALFDYIKVTPGENYTLSHKLNVISANIAQFDKNKNFIDRTIQGENPKTFTLNSSTYYVRVWFNYDNTTTITQEIVDSLEIQFEKGSSATPYTSHQEQIAELNLGDLEYCKIDDYKDRFFKNIPEDVDYDATRELGKWYLKKNINKVTFVGTESFSKSNTNENYTSFFIVKNDVKLSSKVYANYFKNYSYNVVINATREGIETHPTLPRIYMAIATSTASEATDFKNWLSTHNTTVYYELATPTYTLLNDTLQSQLETIYNKLLSYQGQTNISQDNDDLPFNINASAVYDLNKLVERVATLETE